MKLPSWVETPAHFFVPFLSVLISMMFMPRQARETNIGGGGGGGEGRRDYTYFWSHLVYLVFSVVFQQIKTGIVAWNC